MILPSKGDRVRLLAMPDDPDPIPYGSEGTVEYADRLQVRVKWDNGRGLNLIPEVDRWIVL